MARLPAPAFQYDAREKRLAEAPVTTVPTITLDGGIGHNLPQEATQAFAEAIVEVDSH